MQREAALRPGEGRDQREAERIEKQRRDEREAGRDQQQGEIALGQGHSRFRLTNRAGQERGVMVGLDPAISETRASWS